MPTRVFKRTPTSEKAAIYGYKDLLKDSISLLRKKATANVERMLSGGLSGEEMLEMGLAGVGVGIKKIDPRKLVTLYRATSPTVKFGDVFDAEKLKRFKSPKGVEGKFYTSDAAYADYFRESYGKDAVVKSIKLSVKQAKKYETRPGEYFIPKKSPQERLTERFSREGLKYDAFTEPIPGMGYHQWTLYGEGPAKGATFGTKTTSTEEMTEKIAELIRKFSK